MDNYKGYSLFNDVHDEELQQRNRAVVMSNIYEDHIDGQKVNQRGGTLIFGYLDKIEVAQRKALVEEFHKQMGLRGYK